MDKKESIEFKSIKVSDETHSRLAKLGTVGQTFEDVIKSLLDEHDEKVKSKKGQQQQQVEFKAVISEAIEGLLGGQDKIGASVRHRLDYGDEGQSLQDLLDSADFDFSFAGAPQVARNAQDGHREVFVVSAVGVNGNRWAAPMPKQPLR